MPDVGYTVRKWASQATPPIDDPSTLVPLFLESVLGPRISVFCLLSTELQQGFSLDNGLVLQELVDQWLRRVHRGKRMSPDAMLLTHFKVGKTAPHRLVGGTHGAHMDVATGLSQARRAVVHRGSRVLRAA